MRNDIHRKFQWDANMIFATPFKLVGAIIEPPPTRSKSQSSGLVFIRSTTLCSFHELINQGLTYSCETLQRDKPQEDV